MIQNENNTPIWLDIKKEYIDDNLDRLLGYIHNNRAAAHDPFYSVTLRLIRERVKDVLEAVAERPIYLEEIPQENLIFNIRLLACYLLTFPDAHDRIKVLLALLQNVAVYVPKYADDIITLAGNCLKYDKLEKVGCSFNDIIHFRKEIFTYKLCKETRFSEKISVAKKLDGYGRIWQTDEGITITSPGNRSLEERPAALAYSLDTGIGSRLGSFRGEQLKTSDASVFAKMVDFISGFLKSQEQPLRQPQSIKKFSYAPGDSLVVRVTEVRPNFQEPGKFDILVETTDPDYTYLKGKFVFSGPYMGVYYADLMSKYFRRGDYVRAKAVQPDEGTFSFEDTLKEFFVEDTRSNYGVGETLYAELISQVGIYFNWLAENGASICTYSKEGFGLHDLARLKITRFEDRKNYGKINAEVLEGVTQDDIVAEYEAEFKNPEIRAAAIREFIESTPLPRDAEREEEVNARFNNEFIPYLIRLFYIHQRNLPNPVERLRYLANAMALAMFAGDSVSLKFLQFAESYLRAIVSFAVNDNIHDIELPEIEEFADSESVKFRFMILDLLKEYGKSEYSQKLNDALTLNPEEQPLISKLARLIHAANSIRETLTAATLNALKREIVKNLSIETEEDVEIDSDSRPYLGTESQTVEFKTSLVYPPDNNMQPNLPLQSHNIFKAICGFLNSSIGGTLYIGVNDQGYVTGLAQDLNYLKCKNFDTFVRLYIIDPIIKKLGKDVMTYVHIDSGFDDDVAIIKVEPFPFGVVELDGEAYVRIDRETRRMTDRVKAQITHEKLLKDREKADTLRNLQQAKYSRCRVILHDYASSGGGTISNREVEVYDVLAEDGLVTAYDCEAACCKVFSIARMKYVEITDRRWEFERSHKPLYIDAFRISGTPQYSVSLELDLHAKNLLIEQYPRTRQDLGKNANDPNVWYYSATISGLDALARFYVGLADHIKIIDAPELKEYISRYVKDNLAQS